MQTQTLFFTQVEICRVGHGVARRALHAARVKHSELRREHIESSFFTRGERALFCRSTLWFTFLHRFRSIDYKKDCSQMCNMFFKQSFQTRSSQLIAQKVNKKKENRVVSASAPKGRVTQKSGSNLSVFRGGISKALPCLALRSVRRGRVYSQVPRVLSSEKRHLFAIRQIESSLRISPSKVSSLQRELENRRLQYNPLRSTRSHSLESARPAVLDRLVSAEEMEERERKGFNLCAQKARLSFFNWRLFSERSSPLAFDQKKHEVVLKQASRETERTRKNHKDYEESSDLLNTNRSIQSKHLSSHDLSHRDVKQVLQTPGSLQSQFQTINVEMRKHKQRDRPFFSFLLGKEVVSCLRSSSNAVQCKKQTYQTASANRAFIQLSWWL